MPLAWFFSLTKTTKKIAIAGITSGSPVTLRTHRPTVAQERGKGIRRRAQGNLENPCTASPPPFLFLPKQNRLVRKFLSSLFPPPPRMNINSFHPPIKISRIRENSAIAKAAIFSFNSPPSLCFPGHDVLINFHAERGVGVGGGDGYFEFLAIA